MKPNYIVDIIKELNLDEESIDDYGISIKDVPQLIYRVLYLLKLKYNGEVPQEADFNFEPTLVSNILAGIVTKRPKLNVNEQTLVNAFQTIAKTEKAFKKFTEASQALYNHVFIEDNFKPETLRICQIPGCDNFLDKDQGHNAKYCRECHLDGKPKKLANLRYWKRMRGDSTEITPEEFTEE